MDAQQPLRYGYTYQKTQPSRHSEQAGPARLRFRLFGMHWKVRPFYQRAGAPFGDDDAGMLLWLEFGSRSYAN